MQEYCRVEIPMLSVKSIREAEPGMELEEAAFNRDGRVIAEEGEVLTEDRIAKFKNLDVRKIVTLATEIQWLPEDELENLDREVEVLEKKKFSEATGDIVESLRENDTVETIRKTAMHLRRQAHHAGDEEGVDYLDTVIEETRELEGEITEIKDRLKDVEDEEAREELLDALEGKIRQIDETMLNLSAPDSLVRETIDTVQEKEQLRFSLTDYVMNNPGLLTDGAQAVETEGFHEIEGHEASWTGSLKQIGSGNIDRAIDRLIEIVENNTDLSDSLLDDFTAIKTSIRHEVKAKNKLIAELGEYDLDGEDHDILRHVLDGRATLRKSELFDLPVPDDFARRTYEFMENQLDCRHRLWEKTDEVTGGELSELIDKSKFIDNSLQTGGESEKSPGSTVSSSPDRDTLSGNLADDNLEAMLATLEEEGAAAGAGELVRKLEASDTVPSEDVETVRETRSRLETIREEKQTVATVVEEEIQDPDLRDHIREVLYGEEEFDPADFMSLDAPQGILEQVANNLLDEMEARQSLRDHLGELSSGSGSVSDRIDDSRDTVERERQRTIGSVSSSTREESTSAPDNPEAEKRESLQKLVRTREPYKVANQFGLDVSTVKNARQLLQPPARLTDDQQKYCDPLIEEAHKIFYGRELDDDSLEKIAFDIADRLADHNRPLKVLLDPPAGDRYLLSHGINTCLVSLRLAGCLDLDSSDLLDLAAASLALDFGMVEIPMGLWVKDQELSRRADQEVKRHPTLSREIVGSAVNGDESIAELVEQHHERADGSGYPQGLEREEQHPLSPLLGVADAYVAMLEDRPYRSGKQPDVALKTLLSDRGSYDSEAISAIVKQFGIYPDGCLVLLSDKRLALVQSQNPDSPTNPTVLVITDTKRNRLDSPVPEDLSGSEASVVKIVKR